MMDSRTRLMLAMIVSLLAIFINIVAVSSGAADDMYTNIAYSASR